MAGREHRSTWRIIWRRSQPVHHKCHSLR